MRISCSPLRVRLDGNVLVVSLCVSGVLGFVLAGYLTLVGWQNHATIRSLAWNTAIPIAEAGIEEALTQVNANGTNLVANNNWTLVDAKYIQKGLSIGSDRYLAGFFNSYPPVLVAEGFTRLPLGTGTNMVSRTVVVRTALASLFAKGMVARESIDLKGNNVAADSFDSTDPNYSTDGKYDELKNKDNATIATNSNIFNVGNADIKGKIATGPYGVPNVGPNGSVGDNAWVNGGNNGIQPGAWTADMNASFMDIEPPFTSALPPSGGTDGSGNSWDYILSSGNWMISSPMSFGGKVLVTGDAVVYVTSSSDFQFTGNNDVIKIQPNAHLTLYVGSPTATIAGQGVQNESGNAVSFAYYGLPTNTELSYSGNGGLSGTLYAPQAGLSLSGGGTSGQLDFSGADRKSVV